MGDNDIPELSAAKDHSYTDVFVNHQGNGNRNIKDNPNEGRTHQYFLKGEVIVGRNIENRRIVENQKCCGRQ